MHHCIKACSHIQMISFKKSMFSINEYLLQSKNFDNWSWIAFSHSIYNNVKCYFETKVLKSSNIKDHTHLFQLCLHLRSSNPKTPLKLSFSLVLIENFLRYAVIMRHYIKGLTVNCFHTQNTSAWLFLNMKKVLNFISL